MNTTGLPEFEFTIQFKSVGEITQKEYTGTFIYALPTIAQYKEISKVRAEMVDGVVLGEFMESVYDILSELKVCLVKSPDWWVQSGYGENLRDLNVVLTLFTECMRACGKFTEKATAVEAK